MAGQNDWNAKASTHRIKVGKNAGLIDFPGLS